MLSEVGCMCRSITFLSGKGGSGKTTLALSMASLLSSCGVKTLLIDCDLSTNGATYFYEERLSSKRNILSFFDILFSDMNQSNIDPKKEFIQINEFYHFIPSITQITKNITKTYSYKFGNKLSFLKELRRDYDVILYDCQAGYTDILKLILPTSDANLIVMEPDAISSAAMRSLYLKIGNIVNDKKMYQVFNKSSAEEYEIYSKVSGGTVFTNIETIKFDWKIRKAFSVSQIPDMENTSAGYGQQILNVCSVLLPNESIKEKLDKYKTALESHSLHEQEAHIKMSIQDLKQEKRQKQRKLNRSLLYGLTIILSLTLVVVFYVGVDIYHFASDWEIITIVPMIVSAFSILFSGFNIIETFKDKHDDEAEINILQEELDEIIAKRKKLDVKFTEKTTE